MSVPGVSVEAFRACGRSVAGGTRRRGAEGDEPRGGLVSAVSPPSFDFFVGNGSVARTGVVGGDDLPGLGEGHAVAGLDGLDVDAHLFGRPRV